MTPTEHRGFTLTRFVDAPRETVFQAWTDPAHLDWFFNDRPGPRPPVAVDLRVGGTWRQLMVIDDETRYWTGGVYREIVPPERLVFAWGAVDGWPKLAPDHLDDGPIVSVTLDEVDHRTRMRVDLALPDHLSDAEAQAWFDLGIESGMGQTVDRLVAACGTADVDA